MCEQASEGASCHHAVLCADRHPHQPPLYNEVPLPPCKLPCGITPLTWHHTLCCSALPPGTVSGSRSQGGRGNPKTLVTAAARARVSSGQVGAWGLYVKPLQDVYGPKTASWTAQSAWPTFSVSLHYFLHQQAPKTFSQGTALSLLFKVIQMY